MNENNHFDSYTELHPRDPDDEPADLEADRHAELSSGHEADILIERTVDQAPLRRVARRVRDGYEKFGVPFAAFLWLEDTSFTDSRLLDQFEVVYASSVRSLDEAINSELEGLGWDEALREFRTRHGVEPEYLDWNYAELGALIHQLYDVVELDGWLHLFYR
ncbi:hypothetical protein [Brevibacterium sp.]|uniref:hypothetical protein n=1 Tax=Brevibacterium sp. TaxID=1701 RepID=UPI0028123648|nr:hypothetical protein [Brevibacterium sp.]